MSDFPRHKEEIVYRQEYGDMLQVVRKKGPMMLVIDRHKRTASGEWGRPIESEGGARLLVKQTTTVNQ